MLKTFIYRCLNHFDINELLFDRSFFGICNLKYRKDQKNYTKKNDNK